MHLRTPTFFFSLTFSLWIATVATAEYPESSLGEEVAGEAQAAAVETESDYLSLNEVLRLALKENLGLQIDRISPANALDGILIEEAAFDPRLNASFGISETRSAARGSALDDVATPQSDSRQFRIGADRQLTTGATVGVDSNIGRSTTNNLAARNPDWGSDVGVSIRQPLLRNRGREVNLAPLARARIGSDQAVDLFKDSIMDLVSTAEIAYWNLAFARARRDFFLSSLELAETILEENTERERLGLATPIEVLQADAEVVARQEELIVAEREIDDAIDRLFRVIGQDFYATDLPEEIRVAQLPTEFAPAESVRDVVLRSMREDLNARAQERQVEIQRLNRLLAENDVRPDLNVTAGLRYSGRDTSGRDSFEGALSRDGYNYNAGLEVSFPWDFRAARARERQAGRNLEREELVLADLRQQRAIAVRETWRALDAGLKRIEVTSLSVRLNEEGFEQERARFGSGVIAYRSVLEAQRDLDQARLRNLAAIIETVRAQVRLARLDGSILDRNGFSWEEEVFSVDYSPTR